MRRLQKLFETGEERRYKKGQVVLHQGDALTHVYYIKRGYVKVYTILGNGEERTLLIMGPGDAFPVMAGVYVALPKLRYFYEAMSDIVSCRLGQPNFAKMINNDYGVIQIVLEYIGRSNQKLVERLEILENKSAADKVRNILPYLVECCGKPLRSGEFQLDLKLTHQDIASMAGLTRETTSIQMKKLEDQGLINQGRGKLIIKQATLDKADA